jgi:hypothetical protein
MTQRVPFKDAQSALGFVIEQGRTIETKAYQLRYPSYDYASHVPIITQGAEWSIGTVFFTEDMVGKMEWVNGSSTDIPFNEDVRSKFTRDFYMAATGWEWNLEEVNQAYLYNQNINDRKAMGARRIGEQFLYGVFISGSTEKNFTGLINSSEVSRTTVNNDGTGTSTLWANKTGAQRYRDMNDMLSGIRTNTNEVEWADTLRLPPTAIRQLATSSTGTGDGTLSQLEWFRKNNVYTAETGQELDIKGLRSLSGAGLGGLNRMMAYRKDEEVVRGHLPMPYKVLPLRQKSIMGFEQGGIVRTGGTEWRLPSAAAYYDGI